MFERPFSDIVVSSSGKNIFFILRITTTSELVETPRDARCVYGAAAVTTTNLLEISVEDYILKVVALVELLEL